MKIDQKIDKVWSERSKTKHVRLRWWHSQCVVKHINQKICGQPLEAFSGGINQRLLEISEGKTLSKGISVGCGNGQKEMDLLKKGLIGHFHLYELAEARIEQGKQLAKTWQLEDRVTFHNGNAFEVETTAESFDFVHWNNSLHHMLDVEQAVRWSHHILRRGGLFYMDDFIGPSRFQWSDRNLALVDRILKILPEKYLVKPPGGLRKKGIKGQIKGLLGKFFLKGPKNLIRSAKRPTVERMIEMDPSEAADSGRILEMVKRYFPSAEIVLTGGAVYHLALNDIIYNFDDDRDKHLMELLLVIDDLCSELGENHYATAIGVKD